MKALFCLLAFAICFVLMPSVRRFAALIGAIDRPGERRRMHHRPTPRAGGLAIFTAFFFACLAMGRPTRFLACALGGALLILLLGLADDIFSLPAIAKLCFQAAAVTATVLGCELETPGVFFSVLWVLMLSNAHNFIDGLDGLFGGCAVIEGLFLAIAFFSVGAGELAWPPLLLAAACLAFLCYNRSPASIFAGDCGSVTVGFLLAVFSLPLMQVGASPFASLSPLFLFALPLADLILAIARRVLSGKSLFFADRAHLHHRLCDLGVPSRRAVSMLLVISAAMALIGVLVLHQNSLLSAGIACLFAAFLLIEIRHFVSHFV